MINESPHNRRSQCICPYDAEQLVASVERQPLRVIKKDIYESRVSSHTRFRNAMNKYLFKYFLKI